MVNYYSSIAFFCRSFCINIYSQIIFNLFYVRLGAFRHMFSVFHIRELRKSVKDADVY